MSKHDTNVGDAYSISEEGFFSFLIGNTSTPIKQEMKEGNMKQRIMLL